MVSEEKPELNQKSSYRSIFKATSLFGGVQLYQIIVQIIKSKFVAVFLGPAGVGIIGLFQSGLSIVSSISSLGLSTSAVRDVSEANQSGDEKRTSITVAVVRRLCWFTGLLGMVLVICFSPILSKTSFGNYNYVVPFIILSITLLLDQITAAQKVTLQGMRRLKDLAKSSTIGSTIIAAFSIPVYYLLREKGIVPTLVFNSLVLLILAWWFARKIVISPCKISTREAINRGGLMMKMGFSMSVAGILATFAEYILRSYIQAKGGVDAVGLFQSGATIMTTYVGLIFSAIATDFYPRLSAVNDDNSKCRIIICQQGEIGSLILGPMLTLCMLFMPFVLRLLYSDRFLPAEGYITWACLGMLFRMTSWIVSYMFIAKAATKVYLFNEILAVIISFVCRLFGYKWGGLSGVGIAFSISYLLYLCQVFILAHYKYNFSFSKVFLWCFARQLCYIVAILLIVLLLDGWVKYLLGIMIILICAADALIGLDKRMGVLAFVKERFLVKHNH